MSNEYLEHITVIVISGAFERIVKSGAIKYAD